MSENEEKFMKLRNNRFKEHFGKASSLSEENRFSIAEHAWNRKQGRRESKLQKFRANIHKYEKRQRISASPLPTVRERLSEQRDSAHRQVLELAAVKQHSAQRELNKYPDLQPTSLEVALSEPITTATAQLVTKSDTSTVSVAVKVSSTHSQEVAKIIENVTNLVLEDNKQKDVEPIQVVPKTKRFKIIRSQPVTDHTTTEPITTKPTKRTGSFWSDFDQNNSLYEKMVEEQYKTPQVPNFSDKRSHHWDQHNSDCINEFYDFLLLKLGPSYILREVEVYLNFEQHLLKEASYVIEMALCHLKTPSLAQHPDPDSDRIEHILDRPPMTPEEWHFLQDRFLGDVTMKAQDVKSIMKPFKEAYSYPPLSVYPNPGVFYETSLHPSIHTIRNNILTDTEVAQRSIYAKNMGCQIVFKKSSFVCMLHYNTFMPEELSTSMQLDEGLLAWARASQSYVPIPVYEEHLINDELNRRVLLAHFKDLTDVKTFRFAFIKFAIKKAFLYEKPEIQMRHKNELENMNYFSKQKWAIIKERALVMVDASKRPASMAALERQNKDQVKKKQKKEYERNRRNRSRQRE